MGAFWRRGRAYPVILTGGGVAEEPMLAVVQLVIKHELQGRGGR
jgi:hypothetical protein